MCALSAVAELLVLSGKLWVFRVGGFESGSVLANSEHVLCQSELQSMEFYASDHDRLCNTRCQMAERVAACMSYYSARDLMSYYKSCAEMSVMSCGLYMILINVILSL